MKDRYRFAAVGILAGALGFYAYLEAGVLAALSVIFVAGWFLLGFSTAENAWSTLSSFKNPFMAMILGFMLGLAYFSFRGRAFGETLLLSISTGLLGAATGMFLWKYWNIGEP